MRIEDLPSPRGSSRLQLLRARATDRLALLRRVAEECGDMATVRLFRRVVIAQGPVQIREALVEKAKFFEKSPVLRGALYPLAGEGLFTSRGELWRRQRRLMAPLFQPTPVEGFADAMVACASRAAAGWRDGEVVEVAHETTRITMAIAGSTLFGADTFDETDELGAALTEALRWADHATASPLLHLQIAARQQLERLVERLPEATRPSLTRLVDALEPPLLLPTRRTRRLRQAIASLDQRVERLIAERGERGVEGGERRDLLTLLLHARDEEGGRMTGRQVRDEILTLFVAGHETTATGLAWALHFLARDPALARRAAVEVGALGDRAPTAADAARLPLCLRVFKEALRFYPPVYVFGRQAVADVEVGGCEIPRGTIFLVSPYALHHRADLWPDPERFDPDRFLPEAEAQRSRFAWLPFGTGSRSCVGNHFALLEGQLVLATLLQRAELTPLGEVTPDPGATLRPGGGMPMRVRLRGAATVQASRRGA